MTLSCAVILGVVQGLAELLPISSSAHVILTERLLKLDPSAPDMTLLLVTLHSGTMLAALWFFWARWRALSRTDWILVGGGTLVTGVCGLILKVFIEKIVLERMLGESHGQIEELFRSLPLLAIALAASGFTILLSGAAHQSRSRQKLTPADSVWIGIVQAICLPLRGFSRSGATISVALSRGITAARAEEYSFALALALTPAVWLWELKRYLQSAPTTVTTSVTAGMLLVGFVASFAAGALALKLLGQVLLAGWWPHFGRYCLLLSAAVLTAVVMGIT